MDRADDDPGRQAPWSYEHYADSSALPQTIWALWADVAGWRDWNPDVRRAVLQGPFAEGSTIAMTLGDGTVIDLAVADVAADARFVDVAEFDGLTLRTLHLVEPLPAGGSRVTYRLEITGEGVETAGPEVGAQVTADFPETVAGLIRRAEGERGARS